jgi:hypothetical protein
VLAAEDIPQEARIAISLAQELADDGIKAN